MTRELVVLVLVLLGGEMLGVHVDVDVDNGAAVEGVSLVDF